MITAGTVSAPVETKVVASSGTTIFIGLLTWALVTFIPAWHSGIPEQLVPFVPVAAAWLAATYAGYKAPHTHRPDLPTLPPVLPPPPASLPERPALLPPT